MSSIWKQIKGYWARPTDLYSGKIYFLRERVDIIKRENIQL